MPHDAPAPGERLELQATARALGRWQGAVDERLLQHGAHLHKINGSMDTVAEKLEGIRTLLATITGGEEVRIRSETSARTWRMWAIGLAVTAGLAFVSTVVTITIAAIYILTQ